MPYGAPWSGGLPFDRVAGALLVDPSPLLRGTPAGRHLPTPNGADEAAGDLSPRERDLLRLVADGHTSKEIGEKVDLSALTVKSHLARSLGTGDRAHVVAPGIRSGVVH